MALDTLQRSRKPLASSANVTKASQTPGPGLSAFGTPLTSPNLPNAPIPIGGALGQGLQQAQNAANKANQQRYGQGLGVLTGGVNQQNTDIQNAINASQNYGQSAQQKLDYQLQHNLAAQTQSAAGRGLANTTIADTMKDLPTRQYNDASAQVAEMAANRMAGLNLDQANAAAQGSNSIASFINSRTDQGPNIGQYAALQQAANSGRQSPRPSTSQAPPALSSWQGQQSPVPQHGFTGGQAGLTIGLGGPNDIGRGSNDLGPTGITNSMQGNAAFGIGPNQAGLGFSGGSPGGGDESGGITFNPGRSQGPSTGDYGGEAGPAQETGTQAMAQEAPTAGAGEGSMGEGMYGGKVKGSDFPGMTRRIGGVMHKWDGSKWMPV